MLKTRIDQCFVQLEQEKRPALTVFVTAGDPDAETSLKIIRMLPKAGADIIEIGMPFSDPIADGPAIQLAGQRALANGQTLVKTLEMVREFRKNDSQTPVVLMGYYNPIHIFGNERFLKEAKTVGVDGLIIVDLPPEADDELCIPAIRHGISFIRLVTPTTSQRRLSRILKNASGFLYYVSITGVTGAHSPDSEEVTSAIANVKMNTNLPVMAGFGIKNVEQAKIIGRGADGVVIGSAIVSTIEKSLDKDGQATTNTILAVRELVNDLSIGIKQARS